MYQLLMIYALIFHSFQFAFADYKYVECHCSVDFETPQGEVISMSDYVYCPTSPVNNYTCSGNVIGWSLDTICEGPNNTASKSASWAPQYSKEVVGTLSCSL